MSESDLLLLAHLDTCGAIASQRVCIGMLDVQSRDIFYGPSLYARCPAVRLVITHEGKDPNTVRLVSDSLREACALLFPDRPLRPAMRELLRQPTAHPGDVVVGLILEFQRLMSAEVEFGAVQILPTGEFAVVHEFETLATATLALSATLGFVNDMLLGHGRQLSRFRDEIIAGRRSLMQMAAERGPNADTGRLHAAARRRDIPARRLDVNYLLLGQGARSRRLDQNIDDRSSYAAIERARDKYRTNRLLAEAWLPIPHQRWVETAEQARSAAEVIGYPVVVKPRSRDQGNAVSVGLMQAADVERAFTQADAAGSNGVVVEAVLPGVDHRLLVIGGRMVAAARRVPGHIVGDGRLSVAELVDTLNRDPRRGQGKTTPMSHLKIDDEAEQLLAADGLNLASIPLNGQHVPLRRAANLSRGGTAIDVTDHVHPDNRYAAEQAAQAVGLAIAGVDVICPDIARSYKESGGGICEVNFSPGLRMHHAPGEGQSRDAAGAVIDHLFPDPRASRIPVAAVTGTNGKTTTCRMLATIVARHGLCVGLTSTEGVFIGGVEVARGDLAGPGPARQILSDHRVEAAVLECARGGIIKWGVGFDDCNVAAVTNVQNDHIGVDGISSIGEMARVKRLIVELARDMAVLNADDSHCRAMAEHLSAKRLCWVTMAAENPLVDTHIANGGTAVRLTNNASMIALHTGGESIDLMRVADIPATLNGVARHNTANALVAVALAHGLGVSAATVRDALHVFDNSFACNRGRLNGLGGLPFKVLFDCVHNESSYRALFLVVDNMPSDGERVLVFSARSTFDDATVLNIASLVAPHFNRFVCFTMAAVPERTFEEIPLLLRDGLIDAGVAPFQISVIANEADAIHAALRSASAGELMVIKDGLDTVASWHVIQDFADSLAQC